MLPPGGKLIPALSFRTLLYLFNSVRTLPLVKQLHTQIIVNGLYHLVLFGSKLSNSYIEFDSLHLASKAFFQIARKNLYSWNTIISGYSKRNDWPVVLQLYKQMRSETSGIDSFNITFAIKSCVGMSMFLDGQSAHALVVKSGFEEDPYVVPRLIDLYVELGILEDAQRLFESIPERNQVVCGAMMKGYLKFSEDFKVFELFSGMKGSGVELTPFILESLIRACGNVLAGREGKVCHAYCIKCNLIDSSKCLQTSVVDMYMKCGFSDLAVKLFEMIPEKDVVLWTAMISGLAKGAISWEAVGFFKKMLGESIVPNSVTLASIILACSHSGSLLQGKSVHGYMLRNGLDLDLVNYTSFIDLYSKCGCIEAAKMVFDQMPRKNVYSWSAMINGFGMHGLHSEAVSLFDQMISDNQLPNSVTYVSLLSACVHAGRVEEGWKIFRSMSGNYGIAPAEEHYACMVDLLCRAGKIDEALSFISNMPMDPGVCTWGALLSACKIHKRVELAEEVAKKLLPLESDQSSVYVILSQIYANEGMWDMMKKSRSEISEKGFCKSGGFSSVEVDKSLHVFGYKDILSYRNTQIESILISLSKVNY